MSTNSDAAEMFREIADLLDVLGEKFKPEAYRRAARSIESLTEDLKAVAARGDLRTIPGVGEAIAEKIEEYLKTGKVDYYERLTKQVPPGIADLLRLPGLGPKTARRFWLELGVEGPNELAAAIDAGRLTGLKGFGPKKIEQVRAALAAAKAAPPSGRLPIEEAYPIAQRLLAGLRASAGAEQLEIAGSFRRCRETVGDLDLLATSQTPARVFDTFSALPDVREVRLRGPTKETVLLTNGLQVDLRVVEPEEFGAALLYSTGSKDHNVHLRTIARDRGLKINEYGIYRGEERVGGRTEEEMYRALRLSWIPPEIREDRGEVEQAARGAVPRLVEAGDLTGDLHVHLPDEARPADVDRVVAGARQAKLRYVGIVVAGERADGSRFELPRPVLERIAHESGTSLRLERVQEVPADGLPESWPAGEDRIVVRPTRGVPRPPSRKPGPTLGPIVAHLGGEEAARPWIEWLRGASGAIEVGPGPERIDSVSARAALEAGIGLCVVTGVGRDPDDPAAPISLGFARRAGAEKGSVRNAASPASVTRNGSAARTARSRSGA